MLNYIWGGLIVLSFAFAIVFDARDLARDTYRNGTDVPLVLKFASEYDTGARRVPVEVRVDPAWYRTNYDVLDAPDGPFDGTIVRTADGEQLRFASGASVPEPWNTIRSVTSSRDNDLRGPIANLRETSDSTAMASIRFAPVRFVKMQAIASAAIEMAQTAVTLALGLIGVLALWMGLLQIAEKAGLVQSLVRFTQPILRPLFPDIPKDHPALGMIVLNLTANVLGLGNAATPLGIKAMEEMQSINPDPDTATDSMVMLLAMNTASVQLVPPVLLVALMGLQINQLFFAIIIVTGISLLVAVASARILSRTRRYRLKRTTPETES